MIIRRAALAAALPAISMDDTRYHLAAVQCSPGLVESTNGHLAIRMRDRAPFPAEDFPLGESPDVTGYDGTVLIPAQIVATTIKALPAKIGTVPILSTAFVGRQTMNGQHVTITTTDLQSRQTSVLKETEGRFPDLARVVPAFETDPTIDRVTVCLGRAVLETLLKAMKASDQPSREPTVTLTIPLPSAPTTPDGHDRVVDSALTAKWTGNELDGFAVLMPCRVR
jgi:hypothetical protein